MRRLNRRRYAIVHVPLLALGVAICGTSGSSANPAIYEVGDDPALGFNLISWWGGTQGSHWRAAIDNLHAAGFREVSISPLRFFSTATGALTTSGAPALDALAIGVAHAKSLGMRVTLNPFVEPAGFTMWRGQYNPSGAEAATFWSGYESYLVEVAEIAAQHDVDAMNVGTELRDLTRDSAHNSAWNNAINAVDAIYDGPLGYAANWDNYDNENVTTAIWNHPAIDYIGVDSYFNNVLVGYFQSQGMNFFEARQVAESASDQSGTYPNPNFLDLMTSAWSRKLEQEILPFAAARKDGGGMPLVFTEIGYLPRNRTAHSPQIEGGDLDSDEQIMAFEGLLNALDGRGDKFHSLHIWQWGMAGSDGSLWNINADSPANQPDNLPLGAWLSDFATTAVLPLSGDYNRDGAVDAADYTVWRDTVGEQVLSFAAADGNGDGRIDAADYDLWKANFRAVSLTDTLASEAVPEPASWSLALALAAGLATWRWSPRACRLNERVSARPMTRARSQTGCSLARHQRESRTFAGRHISAPSVAFPPASPGDSLA